MQMECLHVGEKRLTMLEIVEIHGIVDNTILV